MNIDFIIVGQGIAGTCVALKLIKENKKFIIFDQHHSNSSSRLALGIYNPLVLKWFTKAWKVDDQIHLFYPFYNFASSLLGEKIIIDRGIYKFLETPYVQNNWMTKQISSGRQKYMSSKLYSINNSGLMNHDFYGLVQCSGRLKIKLLLNSFRNFCKKKNILIQQDFLYQNLIIEKNKVSYNGINADNIIFCEGYSGIKNPYFNNINLKSTKGEILTIYCKNLNLKDIIHSGFLFIPIGNDRYLFGATYDWQNINYTCTRTARAKLVLMLDKILNTPYRILNQVAGIRPSTIDRRPLLGAHKKHNNLYIMNGLGTRGVLLAPYLSNILFNSIYQKTIIPSDIHINRLTS